MLQTVHCIRVGAVFLDKNRELFLLCEKCEKEFDVLNKFRAHLEMCNGLQHLLLKDTTFASNTKLGIKEAEKKHQVYNIDDIKVIDARPVSYKNDKDENYFDLTKIEEELLNPRWYTDSCAPEEPDINNTINSKQTSKCIDPLCGETAFVQLRENVKRSVGYKKLKSPQHLEDDKLNKIIVKIPVQNIKSSHTERAISLTNFKVCGNDKKHEQISMGGPKTTRNQPSTNKNMTTMENKCNESRQVKSLTFSKPKLNTIASPVERVQKQKKESAAEITSKLSTAHQNCAVARRVAYTNINPHKSISPIKQYQTPSTSQQLQTTDVNIIETPSIMSSFPTTSIPTTRTQQTEQILNKLQTLGLQVKRKNTKQEETLKLLKKLQSKGMNVKLVNKSVNPKTPSQLLQNSPAKKSKLEPSIMSAVKIINDKGNNALQANKPNFSRNIVIKEK